MTEIKFGDILNPLVSIIVPSYTIERLGDIIDLLESIQIQSYENIETILAVERSTELFDKMKSYVDEEGIRDVRVVLTHEMGASSARNIGIEHARGDILAFVDDDVVLFPNWAEELVKTYIQDDSIIGVTGPAFPLWEGVPVKWFPEEFYWIIGSSNWCNWSHITEVRNCWGMNMSFKRRGIDLCGYFRNSFGLRRHRRGWHDPPSEDVDLSIRVRKRTGKRLVYNPQLRVKHKVLKHKCTWSFIIQRSYSVGYQRRMIKRLYSEGKDSNLLAQEHQLLRRIFTRLFPDILKGFFVNPVNSSRKFMVTVVVLFFVVIGYFSSVAQHPSCRELETK